MSKLGRTFGLLVAALGLMPAIAMAEYPEKPIQMLIGFRAGGSVDTTGRLLAENLEKVLGQPVVAVTKSGGGGAVMAATLINEEPDGYVIGMGSSAAYTLSTQMNSKIGYTLQDFDHLATLTIPEDALVAAKDTPFASMDEMIAYAKSTGKPISIAAQVAVVNMMTKAIENKDGVKFRIVPVKGGSGALQQVLGGHVDLAWVGGGWHKHAASGDLKPLASIGKKRNPDYPDLPTLDELGYGFTFNETFMLSAPKGLPQDVLDKLADAIAQSMTPELSEKLLSERKLATELRGPTDTTEFLEAQYNEIKPLVDAMKQN